MIRILLIDDHPIVINGIKQLINRDPDMTVVGTAMNGADTKELLKTTPADILLLDINLPDINGLDLCQYIKTHYPFLRIIALTGFKEYFYLQKMIHNGASGYLLKNALPEEITQGIRTVYNGDSYFCEEAGAVLKTHKEKGIFLTVRETELLRLIVEGYTNRQIAEKLYLGVETINSYRKNLLIKLGVKNTAAMVKLALTERLI
jgi:DNA-binding NarL/FixJ family response regulator